MSDTAPETVPVRLHHPNLKDATFDAPSEEVVEVLAASGWKKAPKSEQPKPPPAA